MNESGSFSPGVVCLSSETAGSPDLSTYLFGSAMKLHPTSWPLVSSRASRRLTGVVRHFFRKAFSYDRKRLWYWTAMHALSILRLRRRVVLALVAVGLILALVVTWRTTPVFSGVVHVEIDRNPEPGTMY
jgi:hypothetical protein